MAPNDVPPGLAVFVVEDEALVALNLESMLDDLGCRVVGPAMRFDRAQAMIDEGVEADVAILDVNIGGRSVFDLAVQIRERGIPILFATGYGRGGIPGEWQHRPILQKPYTERDVGRAIREALAGAERTGD
ncbi:MAG: response regulator [Rhizobiales bacterium]|nr:response regulator [Hyphomicrobiales bacterium]